MNTAEYIVTTITRTAVEIAAMGTFLKIALVVAPRFQIAAPKAPVQPKAEPDAAEKAPAAAADKPPVSLAGAA